MRFVNVKDPSKNADMVEHCKWAISLQGFAQECDPGTKLVVRFARKQLLCNGNTLKSFASCPRRSDSFTKCKNTTGREPFQRFHVRKGMPRK